MTEQVWPDFSKQAQEITDEVDAAILDELLYEPSVVDLLAAVTDPAAQIRVELWRRLHLLRLANR